MTIATYQRAGLVKPDGKTVRLIGNGGEAIIQVPGVGNATELQGVPISTTPPTAGQVLEYNGTDWTPGTPAGGITVQFGVDNPNGSGTPSLVQATTGSGYSISFGSNVTSGNLLLVAYKSEGTITGVTVSDTLGTSYSLIGQVSGEANNMNVYAGVAPASGANRVTIGSPAANYDRMGIAEVAQAGATVDGSAVTSYENGTPWSLDITTTNPVDFIFAAVGGYHNTMGWTFDSPFTLDSTSDGSDANAIGHLVTSSAGTYTLTANVLVGGADNQPVILVALESVGGTPVAGSEGDLYFQTGGSTYVGWVYHSSAWHQFS